MPLSKRPRSPATLLIVFVLAICMAMTALEIWRYSAEYRYQLHQANAFTGSLANSLIRHAEDTLEIADSAVLEVVERVSRGDLKDTERGRLDAFLKERVLAVPRLTGIFVYDKDGNWLGSSRPTVAPYPNNADRAYFQHHRNDPGRGPYLGPPVRSRSGGHEWIVTVSRRMTDSEGRFAGVVLASVASTYFSTFYSQLDVGQHGAVSLLNEDGTLLARYPHDDKLVGADFSSLSLFQQLLHKSTSGFYEYRSPADGVQRMSSYSAGSRFPVVVLTALGRDELLAEWKSAALLHALAVLGVVAAVVSLGSLLLAQLKRREAVEKRLTELATTDALTGLANRRMFDEVLKVEWRRAARTRLPLSLLLIDLDRFKLLNDNYGHVYGDEALREVGRVLKALIGRAGDLAARFGGEELAVLLPDTDAEGCRHIAETIRARIQGLGLAHGANMPSGVVTASLGGITVMPQHRDADESPERVIEQVDAALYRAKDAGRNRVVLADPTEPLPPRPKSITP